jgi:hypothetical protein
MMFCLNITHKKCRQQKRNAAVHGLKLESRNWGEMKLFICVCAVGQDDRTGVNLPAMLNSAGLI